MEFGSYIIDIDCSIVSSTSLCIVRWYKARERDDINGSQAIVWEVYYKYIDEEEVTQRRRLLEDDFLT